MLAFIFAIGFDLFIALAVMTGLWIYLNGEEEKVMEIKKVVVGISKDAFNLVKNFKALLESISEITQPLASLKIIDTEIKPLIKAVEEGKEVEQD